MQIEEVQAFVRLLPNSGWFPIQNAHKPMPAHLTSAVLLPNCTPEVANAIKAQLADNAEVRDLRGRTHDEVRALYAKTMERQWAVIARALDMPEDQPFTEYVEAVREAREYANRCERSECHEGDAPKATDAELEARHPDNNADFPARVAEALDMPVGKDAWKYLSRIEDLVDRSRAVSPQEYESVRADNERLRAEVARLEQVASELQESFNEVCATEKRLRADLEYLDRKFTEHCDEMGKALGTDLKLTPSGCVAELNRLHSVFAKVLEAGPESSWSWLIRVASDTVANYDSPEDAALIRAYNQGCADTVAAFRKAQGDA